MDLTTNEIYKQIQKIEKYNILKNTKPIKSSISIKSRLDKLHQPKVEDNIDKYFIMIILNESNISNFIYNSSLNQKINICFNNLEYLSITDNYLINLNFILNLPELFYLDAYGNPLEEFEALNYKNIFGYLRLTVDNFHEKKILAISGLNCSILDFYIEDKTILRIFKINNPNIMMLNNEILYHVNFLIESETKKRTRRMNNIINQGMNVNKSNSNEINKMNQKLMVENNKYRSEKNVNFLFLKKELNQFQELNKPENLKLINKMNNTNNSIKITSKNLLDIKNFFDELNQVMTKITKKAKGRIRPQYLFYDSLYLNVEKKRLLLLYHTYMKLNIFNERKRKYFNDMYIKNIEAINSNKFCDEIKIYEVKHYIKCININIRFGIIILISMLFYCLNLVSMKMAITIIHYLLLKYYKFDEHKQFQYFNTFGNLHYLCYYLDNLEDFKTKLKFAEESQVELYQKILDILEVPKLILNVNKLKQKQNYFIKNKNISQKNRVSTLLSDISELKIESEIFFLIEFFCDFIQYEDIEQLIINGSENDEYSTLIEIKELLEQNELKKNHLFVQDLSVKKFYKNKLESTFNKFFFENNKIKMVKNKVFKKSNENRKNISKNKLNLISFFYNWNREYKKGDEFSTKNCLTVDKCKTKGKNTSVINNNNSKLKNIKSYENIEKRNYSNEKDIIKKKINLSRNIFSNKNLNPLKNNFNKEQDIYYKTEANNIKQIHKNFKIKENIVLGKENLNQLGVLSTKNVFNQANKFVEVSDNQNKNNFKLLSNYFNKLKNSKKTFEEMNKNLFLKTFSLKKSIKDNKFKQFKGLEEQRNSFSNKRINSKKENEMPYININALRLYDKKKIVKKKMEVNDIFDDDLLVEKYNQEKHSKIIRKILEKQNKLLNERIQKSRNFAQISKK